VETHLLGVHRSGDVEGWEIPGRYFGFLDGGPAAPLVDVLRHNDTDVRSLALLVALIERQFGDEVARAAAPAGDLAGLARAFVRERRLPEALDCLDAALAGDPAPAPAAWRDPFGRTPPPAVAADDLEWLVPRRCADFGGPISRGDSGPWPGLRSLVAAQPWTSDRMEADRARILRRLGRHDDAEAAWRAIAGRGGAAALHAWIEVAKLREHRLGDPSGALEATHAAARIVRRQPLAGLGLRRLEHALRAREARLSDRLLRAPQPPGSGDLRAPSRLPELPELSPVRAGAAP
jgi:tetratricopeptide (TPR) repeat protein